MKRLLTLGATLALMAGAAPLVAQTAVDDPVIPGDQFFLQWDMDSDGKVTLNEARSHRADIFAMFDSDSNGSFSAEELKGIDEHKLMQAEAGMGPGHQRPEGMQPPAGMQPGMGQGQGRGMGKGPGQGQGQGRGQGQVQGMGFFQSAQEGMMAFDGNGDGQVTQAEFVAGTDAWFRMRDFSGDGVLSLDDFGPRR